MHIAESDSAMSSPPWGFFKILISRDFETECENILTDLIGKMSVHNVIQFPVVGWVSVTFSHCGWGPLSDLPVTGAGEELVLVEADLPAPRSVQGLTNQEPDSFKP